MIMTVSTVPRGDSPPGMYFHRRKAMKTLPSKIPERRFIPIGTQTRLRVMPGASSVREGAKMGGGL